VCKNHALAVLSLLLLTCFPLVFVSLATENSVVLTDRAPWCALLSLPPSRVRRFNATGSISHPAPQMGAITARSKSRGLMGLLLHPIDAACLSMNQRSAQERFAPQRTTLPTVALVLVLALQTGPCDVSGTPAYVPEAFGWMRISALQIQTAPRRLSLLVRQLVQPISPVPDWFLP